MGYGDVAREKDMGVLRIAEGNKFLEECCSSSSPLSWGMSSPPSLPSPLGPREVLQTCANRVWFSCREFKIISPTERRKKVTRVIDRQRNVL